MDLSAIIAILQLAFSIPVIVTYRLLPTKEEPYWLYGPLLILLISHVLISLPGIKSVKKDAVIKMRTWLFWMGFIIVFFGTFATLIRDRAIIAPGSGYRVHDIILQLEAALRFLGDNKNPYKESYFGTIVEQFGYQELGRTAVNPALYHFVMPPWYLIFPAPFYYLSNKFLGFFDGRIPLFFTLLGLSLVLIVWFRKKDLGYLALLITLMSPSVINYHFEGRSDGFALFWFVLSLYLLSKHFSLISGSAFALAIMSKQTIWFAVPFYYFFAWLRLKNKKQFVVLSISGIITVLILLVPFLVWDFKAFLDSVVFYLSGNIRQSYPVSGFGFGMILYQLKVIKDIHDYFPFVLLQLAFGLPLYYFLLRWLAQKPTTHRLLIGYALTLLVIWYFSRYFNNSHLAYIGSVLILGVLRGLDEQDYAKEI